MADTDPISPLLFWLTDRSHYEMGVGKCARERFLSKHAGVTGYGFVAKAESLPLATGTYLHQAAAELFHHIQQTGTLPTAQVIRAAVTSATSAYEALVVKRGFRGLLASESSEEVAKEQCALLTGMVWAFALKFLPWFHQNYEPIAVEVENLVVLDCSCGRGPLEDAQLHIAKGCDGIVLQVRQDLIARKRATGALAYFELKTTGLDSGRFMEQWEIKPQLSLGTLRAEQQWGAPITELYVVGLYKGYRKKSYDENDKVTGVKQASPFCYGYKRPGNPPLTTDDWKATYRYWDPATNKKKQVTKDYVETGVWNLDSSDWPTWAGNKAQDSNITPAECWVRTLPDLTLESQLYVLGPFNPQPAQLEMVTQSIVGEEKRWQTRMWEIYGLLQECGWASAAVQTYLDLHVPCSWNCRPYGAGHQCVYLPICLKQQGWEDPMGSGKYVPRRPHHDPELQQAVARGLLPEEGEEVEELE